MALLDKIGWRSPRFLAVLAVALGLAAFIKIADEVFENETRSFDEALLLALRTPGLPADPIGPIWLEETMRDITALGGTAVLCIVVLAVTGLLALAGRRREAIALLAAVGGGMVLSLLLKLGFDRPRPELVPHGMAVYTSSFPSGHSMMAAVTYLTLGSVIARDLRDHAMRACVLALAVAITVAVGISRVYLGVHWPTDVLAGWAIGAAWAALSSLVVLAWSTDREG